MLTPVKYRAARAQLGISQRSVAEQAGVPRSYLRQFERGRWIPTDAFLSKLTDFYIQHGIHELEEPEPSAVKQPPKPEQAYRGAASHDRGTDSRHPSTKALTPEANSRSRWRAVGRAALAIGLIGGVLAATGNLPAALIVIKRLIGARQPRPPF